MKATGIVRRIDELGRVVIPKEIRSTLRLKSGDPILTTLKNIPDLNNNQTVNRLFSDDNETYYILAMLAIKERLHLSV